MPAVTRLGDYCSGHSCYPPRANIQASSNVYVNGRGWHRQTDLWQVHCCDDECHAGTLASGSDSVYVNSRQGCRIGDPVSCGSVAIQGSGNVYCGN